MIASKPSLNPSPDFICPACKGELQATAEKYHCLSCDHSFPILCGISDFRLRSDRYLSLSDERKKAQYLHNYGKERTLTELIKEYYRITDDVPVEMAEQFSAYVLGGEERGVEILATLPSNPGKCLDLGCASAGTLVAARRYEIDIIGVDIALRWLVIGAKRMREAGLSNTFSNTLVCADVAALPFRENKFDTVIAADLLEHIEDPAKAISVINTQLRPMGNVYFSAANRYTVGPYPLAGMWGVGFLPAALRRRYVKARKGIDTLRNATLLSPSMLSRLLKKEGMTIISRAPLSIPPTDTSPTTMRSSLMNIYRALCKTPVLRELILRLGPAFEIVAQRKNTK